jgi:hypothetical protein
VRLGAVDEQLRVGIRELRVAPDRETHGREERGELIQKPGSQKNPARFILENAVEPLIFTDGH